MTDYPQYCIMATINNTVPSIRIYFDTEARIKKVDGEQHHFFRLGYIIVNDNHNDNHNDTVKRTEYRMDTPQKLFDIIENTVTAKQKAWVFCHNYNYDAILIDLFTLIKNNDWEITGFVIDSDMFIVHCKKGNRYIVFVDTFNYFHVSIEDMGRQMGLPKLKVDFDNVDSESLYIYCKRDTEILEKYIEQFIKWWNQNDYGEFKYTLASLAFEAWRHKFLKANVWVHRLPEACKLEIDSYHGGRTEAFFIGEVKGKKVYKLDVNSLYPFVMRKYEYPVALVNYKENPSVHELYQGLHDYLVIADVDIFTPQPAFPVKDREKGKLVFPTGNFRTVITTPELYEIKNGNYQIRKVYRMATYRGANVFSSFINHFYEKRLEFRKNEEKIYDTFSKLLMNSLYGKFGQRNWKYKLLENYNSDGNIIEEIMNDFDKKITTVVSIAGKSFEKTYQDLSRYAFPAISAHVTGYARMLMWKYLQIAGGVGSRNCYYCDTDSLFVNHKGYKKLEHANLISNSELGKLKIEQTGDYMQIRNLKDYTFGEEVKRKGIKKYARHLGENVFEQEQFLKIRSTLRGYTGNFVVVKTVKKQLSQTYDKGIVNNDGWVSPFVLNN